MKRTPMKRTAWPRRRDLPVLQALDESRKVFAPTQVHKATRRAVMVPVAAAPAAPVVKHTYIRSKKLLQACREIPCQWCGIADGTVVAAHTNWGGGKGRSIKASDQFVASLCHRCHGDIDQGSYLTKDERVAIWTAAHERTVKELNRLGLWPKGVPQP